MYSARKLWIAYGTAIALATLAVMVGLNALMQNGASFSNNFSTIFRAARGAIVSAEPREKDLDGKDPLPAYLSRSLVWLGTAHNGERTRMSENTSGATSKSDSTYLQLPPLEVADIELSLGACEASEAKLT